MCYRTQLNSRIKEIEKVFEATFISPGDYRPMDEINAFDFMATPVITDENPGEIQFFNWGLVPFWARDVGIRKMTLNAKIESLTEKPAFRNSVSNRCLVLANGFYEWQWLDSKGKLKQKFFIRSQDQSLFAFAGIHSTWKDPVTGQWLNTYSILTTEANELMSEIHNTKKRMPVVLRKEDKGNWLAGTDFSRFSFPYEADLQAREV